MMGQGESQPGEAQEVQGEGITPAGTKASEGVRKNQSARKVFHILEALMAAPGPMRLQDLAKQLGMPSSTVFRFLNTMLEMGYVIQEPDGGRYRLSLKLSWLGSQLHAQYPFNQVLRPYLEEVSRKLRESVSLSVERDSRVVYIDTVDGPDHMLRTLQHIGTIAPMHSTGAGKVLLLNYSEEELQRFLAVRGLPSFTRKTITESQALRRELEKVRDQGYAYDDEECEIGVRCVAFPVRDFTGTVVASISISAPVTRLSPDRQEEILRTLGDVSTRASQRLGWEQYP